MSNDTAKAASRTYRLEHLNPLKRFSMTIPQVEPGWTTFCQSAALGVATLVSQHPVVPLVRHEQLTTDDSNSSWAVQLRCGRAEAVGREIGLTQHHVGGL